MLMYCKWRRCVVANCVCFLPIWQSHFLPLLLPWVDVISMCRDVISVRCIITAAYSGCFSMLKWLFPRFLCGSFIMHAWYKTQQQRFEVMLECIYIMHSGDALQWIYLISMCVRRDQTHKFWSTNAVLCQSTVMHFINMSCFDSSILEGSEDAQLTKWEAPTIPFALCSKTLFTLEMVDLVWTLSHSHCTVIGGYA